NDPAPATSPAKLPKTFKQFVSKYPALGEAHQRVGKEVENLGPMDAKACALVKIGISLGAGLETAVRSHVRRAMEAGASEEEVEQAILLGMNTVGFPRTVAAWSWAQVQFERNRAESDMEQTDAGDR
ncbi:MAG: carboxymuconolactone decarboxylase family protein, partial [Phycisphaeraceae bacterium]